MTVKELIDILEKEPDHLKVVMFGKKGYFEISVAKSTALEDPLPVDYERELIVIDKA